MFELARSVTKGTSRRREGGGGGEEEAKAVGVEEGWSSERAAAFAFATLIR